ncbi:type II toxin-antitoxin system VapC family toxin [Agrobacterium rosae]|uniref:PIN domain-containing protein n=1 Tax=Agrobacterium rosae TaxID=1972867 RepID=A0AAE5RZX8_9HYPH|nr:type II toxin-antitoxin system VapC family toxin [Agrobacterium rosae]KAA3509553.1 type II toxin-antitoxin system VapC family toxin [Agrobacterium rosae]KAA3516453.1 type II toxin-antitoxin system VapC family toxin [Agrobacterium rosae]MCM2434966.1 type II toxin-antitoxin system VapC family toxin [Agrobacterium rosae]MDX8304869.1 type II toxin-antitoxin system VapC family toxin [Agrobacterium rosae]MDX8315170.1 type II toxin-antitoxin system VapC family toxin [Agrobacterium rosae]
MKILLDSHAIYWWAIGSERLSARARALIEDKTNVVLVSAVSFYELDNKMRLNKLDLKPQELRAAVTASGLQTLAITDLHAELAASFDWDHRDPWDRILAAQTRLEHCVLISTDVVFDTVLNERIW